MFQILLTIIILSGMLMAGTRRIKLLSLSFSFQSFAIAVLCLGLGFTKGENHYYILGIMTLIIKVFIIPLIVGRSVKTLKINRELNLMINGYYSFILPGIYITTIFLAFKGFDQVLKTGLFLLLVGATLMIARRKAITQMFGFLTIENGIILFEISIVTIPIVLEAWMGLEVLILALIMGIMIFRINKTFDTVNTDYLSNLKE